MDIYTIRLPEHNNKKRHYDIYTHSYRTARAEIVVQKTNGQYLLYKGNEIEELFPEEVEEYMKTKDVYLFEILIGG